MERTGAAWSDHDLAVVDIRGHIVDADPVLTRLAEFRATSAKALLVVIDSPGGFTLVGMRLFYELLDVSRSGRPVVTYVKHQAASAAATLVLAGDMRLIATDSVIRVHGVTAAPLEGWPTSTMRSMIRAVGGATPEITERLLSWATVEEANEAALEIYSQRTRTPRAEVERWLSCRVNDEGAPLYAELCAETAVIKGWCDWQVFDLEQAREMALAVALGDEPLPDRAVAVPIHSRQTSTFLSVRPIGHPPGPSKMPDDAVPGDDRPAVPSLAAGDGPATRRGS